jgi:hypothetical protein
MGFYVSMFLPCSMGIYGCILDFFGGDLSERSSLLIFFLLEDGLASVEDG